MSEGVKVHAGIKDWDCYALFDKDNVLVGRLFYHNLQEALDTAFYDDHTVWSVTLTRKDKVNDHNAVKIQPCGQDSGQEGTVHSQSGKPSPHNGHLVGSVCRPNQGGYKRAVRERQRVPQGKRKQVANQGDISKHFWADLHYQG